MMTTARIGKIRRHLIPFVLASLVAGCALEFPILRGEELGQQGRWEEAVQAYQEATRSDPRNTEARVGLARAMLEAAAALVRQGQELERADRLSEADVAYRRALVYDGENQQALAGLERLARADLVKDRLSRARERMGKSEWRAALADVQAALRLDPENGAAKTLRQELNARITADTAAARAETDAERQAQQLFSTKPVTLRFRDTDIKEVLEVISRTAGVNIFTDESLQPKRITTFFQNLPLRESFNLILTSNRLFAKKVAENTVIVVPDNPGKRQQYDELVVQTFYLTDADAKVVVNLLRTILNTRQVFVNEKLNALVVRETPEKIELARKVLEANDRGVAEVEIDLEVLEVDRNSLQNLGIDLSPRTYSVTLNIPQQIPITTFWSGLKFGSTVSITSPSIILNLVKNDGNTNIVANPTVRILDRQKARLLVGERRPFQISSISSNTLGTPTTGTTPGTGGSTVGTTTETRVEYRDLGLKLTMTPTVHLNGEVTVELNFEISAAGAPIPGISGGELLPPVNTRNLDTFIKVKNGETRLLGGLYQDVGGVANSKIPFLSDLPGVGRLFISGNHERRRTDVLISLTPRIVKILERPDPDIESFSSGTADSFGPAAPDPPTPPGPAGPTATRNTRRSRRRRARSAYRARHWRARPAALMRSRRFGRQPSDGRTRPGVTLIELLVAVAVLGILAGVAMPLAQVTATRTRELELRRNLRKIRESIDQFKVEYDKARGNVRDAREIFKKKVATDRSGYPLTLDEMVETKVLRRIPPDPMSSDGKWVMRSFSDNPDSSLSDGKDVYDIRSASKAVALDGTRHDTW